MTRFARARACVCGGGGGGGKSLFYSCQEGVGWAGRWWCVGGGGGWGGLQVLLALKTPFNDVRVLKKI